MRVLLSIAVGASVLALTACGGSEPEKASKDSESSTWSMARSAREFTAIFAYYDDGISKIRFLDGQETKTSSEYNEACAGFAEVLRENAEKVSTGQWPAEVKVKMDRFAVSLEEERKEVVDCQNATTMKEVEEALRLRRENSSINAGLALEKFFAAQ
ncbi:MAG: hypothetical protein ACRDOT_07945 [Aeromicrobium sp.]